MPTEPPPPTALAIAGDTTRDRLLRAALDVAAEIGVDRTTGAAVATRAGVSRPTVYSYFGDVRGALAEAWMSVGPDWLATMVRSGDVEAVRAHPWHPVLTALVLAAPRIDELGEVVGPDVLRAVVLGGDDPDAVLRSTWSLALELGAAAARPVVPGIDVALTLVPLVHALPADARRAMGIGNEPWTVPPIEPVEPATDPDDDPTTASLVRASVEVVARAGVVDASMNRICRAARVTTGAANPRFAGVHDLVLRGFALALDEVIADNVGWFPSLDAITSPWDAAAVITVAGLGPARATWRRYRQELYLAATHDPEIAAVLAAAVERTDESLALVGRTLGLAPDVIRIMLAFNNAATIGFAALHRLDVPVVDLDHRIMYRWLTEPLRS